MLGLMTHTRWCSNDEVLRTTGNLAVGRRDAAGRRQRHHFFSLLYVPRSFPLRILLASSCASRIARISREACTCFLSSFWSVSLALSSSPSSSLAEYRQNSFVMEFLLSPGSLPSRRREILTYGWTAHCVRLASPKLAAPDALSCDRSLWRGRKTACKRKSPPTHQGFPSASG